MAVLHSYPPDSHQFHNEIFQSSHKEGKNGEFSKQGQSRGQGKPTEVDNISRKFTATF